MNDARLWLATFLVLLVAGAPAAAASERSMEPSRIVVRGTGSVPVSPDRAKVVFSIESRAPSPADAANGAADIQKAVLDALRGAGIAEGVTSVGYSVTPEWKQDQNRNRHISGYVASSTVLLETTSLGRVGEFIDVALAAGVTGVRSVMFEASNVDAARREALAAATEQARLDAEAIARAAGGRLGKLLEITLEAPKAEPGVVVRRYSLPATKLEPGQLFVTATILARWRFEQQ